MRFRGRPLSFVTLLLIVVCFSVALQILGAPITYGQLNGSDDLVQSSLLEGFCPVADSECFMPSRLQIRSADAECSRSVSMSESIFRPPSVLA